jgi:hypothetical protein
MSRPLLERHLGIEIARPRVTAVLARTTKAPVRMLCAPHGGGTSTALLQYARAQAGTQVISLPPDASRVQVVAALADHAAASLTIVDHADAASPAGRETLFEHIEAHVPGGKRYVLGGSSRSRMHALALVARGIAVLIDASVLPFSADEIGELARGHHVAADAFDVAQLTYDTDGWPVAVAWIIRDAAEHGRTLSGALEGWRQRNGHLILEFVAAAHGDAPSARIFAAAIGSLADPASQRALERLDAAGYPLVRMRAGLRPYRLLMRRTADAKTEDAPAFTSRMTLTLLGRFACTIGERRVAFGRRRDQNVLAYVALAPDASVTREELLATFWPDASRAVASQGLRTTLCRLRRALADAAGADAGRYLRVDASVALDLAWVAIDARWFRAFVDRADADAAKGHRRAALEHYRHAERLYTGALFASEALEPMLAPYVAAYRDCFARVLAQVLDGGSSAVQEATSSSRSPIMTSI